MTERKKPLWATTLVLLIAVFVAWSLLYMAWQSFADSDHSEHQDGWKQIEEILKK